VSRLSIEVFKYLAGAAGTGKFMYGRSGEAARPLACVCAPWYSVSHLLRWADIEMRERERERERERGREALDPIGKMSFRERDGDEKRNSARLETRSTMLVFYFSLLLSSFSPLALVSLPLQQPGTKSARV